VSFTNQTQNFFLHASFFCHVQHKSLHLILHLFNNFASDKIKKNEIGVRYGAYGGGERRVQSFGGGNLRERD
jgi:hypothetical protein